MPVSAPNFVVLEAVVRDWRVLVDLANRGVITEADYVEASEGCAVVIQSEVAPFV